MTKIKKSFAVLLFAIFIIGCLTFCAYSVKAETSGDFEYSILEDGTVEITKYVGTDTVVTVPDSIEDAIVTSIGESAFTGCKSITTVSLPDSITKIKYRAFAQCTSLSDINIPNHVVTIGSSSFSGCTSLTNITLPDSVEYLLSRAFYDCTNLASIKLSEGLTDMNYIGIFENCSSLDNVTVPNGVSAIAEDTFKNCTNLKNISFSEGLITLGPRAFWGCSSLQSISTPESLTTIQTQCFLDCSSLQSVTISKGVTTIGSMAFSGCDLSNISVDANNSKYDSRDGCNAIINTANNSLYVGCKNTVIPDSILSIDKNAFYHCPGLNSISIPDNVTYIGDYAFSGCKDLVSVELPEGLSSISASLFSGCSKLNNITLPDNLSSIGNDAFHGCSSLENIEIPATVQSIGNAAFSECSGLKNIEMHDGVQMIGESAFYRCSELESVKIPDSVTSIGQSIFKECSKLKAVVLSNSIKEIPSYAFQTCRLLENILIPDGVTSVGGSAFHNCDTLKRVVVPGTVTSFGQYAFGYYRDNPYQYTYPYNKVAGFTIIGTTGSSAEMYAKNNSFSFYENVPADYSAIEAAIATIPEDLTVYTEKSVAALQVAKDRVDYNKYAFEQDEVNEVALAIENAVSQLQLITDYRVLDEKTAEIIHYNGDEAFLTIPVEIDGYKIVQIAAGAFSNNEILSEVIVPEGVVNIENEAFRNIPTLTKVSLPNSVTEIGAKAFLGCDSLKTISLLDNIQVIGEYAFGFTESLEKTEDFSITGYRKSIAEQYALSNGLGFNPIDADYSAVDAAIMQVPDNLDLYTTESVEALQAALDAVERGKLAEEQEVVDKMAADILEALQNLNMLADYAAVDAAIAQVPEDLDNYTAESVEALEAALNAVIRGKTSKEQAEVDQMGEDILTAIDNLVRLADYSAVDAAIAKIPANLDEYTANSVAAMQAAVNAVVRGKGVDEQAAVDKMANDIENAISALEVKTPPSIDEEHLSEAIMNIAKYAVNNTTPSSTGNYLLKRTINRTDVCTIAYYPGKNQLALFLERTVEMESLTSVSMTFNLANLTESDITVDITPLNAPGSPGVMVYATIYPYEYVLGAEQIVFSVRSTATTADLTQHLGNSSFDYAIAQWNNFLKSTSGNEILNFGFCSYCEHSWETEKVVQDQTCESAGEFTRTCSRCSYLDVIDVPATGHTWNDFYTTDKEATQTEDGMKSIHCSVCGEIKEGSEQVIPRISSMTGWITQDGKSYYYENGTAKKGWLQLGKSWYYLDPSTGAMQTGLLTVNGQYYYMVPTTGIMETGWIKDNDSWYYALSSGALATGWVKVGNTWYYMNPDTAIMQTGLLQLGSSSYYLDESGAMKTGWIKYYENWFYALSGGQLAQGWQNIGGKWYYFEQYNICYMLTGWINVNGNTYYMFPSGAMATGWAKNEDNNCWYYLGSSGAAVTGWQKINGVWYFFKPNRRMAQNEWYSGYWLSASGAWTYPYRGSWHVDGYGWWFGDTSGWYAKNQTVVINDYSYTFDGNGYWRQ